MYQSYFMLVEDSVEGKQDKTSTNSFKGRKLLHPVPISEKAFEKFYRNWKSRE